jgi:flagellar assembly factor FliW
MAQTGMKIRSRQFGEIDVERDDLIRLVGGLVGFEDHEEFALFRSREYEPFLWLLALADPDLEFALAEPELFIVEPYHLNLGDADRKVLALDDDDPVGVFLVVSATPVGRTLTANMKGPIIINWRTRLGKQFLLYSSRYSAKQPIHLLRGLPVGPRPESIHTEVRVVGRKAA